MLRRLTLLAAPAAALALPAAAHAATLTVDPAAAAGCTAANVCKTITDANAKAADGDTVQIKDGTYNEAGPILVAKKNVTFKGTPGKVVVTQSDGKTDTPVFRTAEGTVLDGLVVSVQKNGAQAVVVNGPGTQIKNSSLARLAASAADAAVVSVATGITGSTALSSSLVFQAPPTTATDVAPPGILGNATSSLSLADTVVVVGDKGGAGVVIGGAGGTAQAPVAHTITRSTILATAAPATGIAITQPADGTVPVQVKLDSTIIAPGTNGTAVSALADAADGGLVGSAGGAVTVTGTHVTIAGGSKPVALDARVDSLGNQLTGANIGGPVNATFTSSIVHGKAASTVTTSTNAAGSSVAKLTISGSDATDATTGTTIAVTGSTKTADDALFADVAKRNFHLLLGSPAIDKGAAVGAGESTTDVDGEPRVAGPASDLGADEYTQLAPRAVLTASTASAKQGETVTFDASKSSDPNPGDGIVKYTWDFGDGQTAETTTPTTTHAYGTPGSFQPKLVVTDKAGAPSAEATTAAIAISDGTPPTISITSPKGGAALKIFKVKKTKVKIKTGKDKGKTKTKTTKTRLRFTFAGTSSDAAGVKTVALSLRRVSLSRTGSSAATSCVYLSGTTFTSKSCKKPIFFFVRVAADGTWAYKTKSTIAFKAGRYELSAVATDANGVASAPAKVTFTLR